MNSVLAPYPEMKDSGVPWLGKVPDHWEVKKLRNILKPVAVRRRSDLPLLSVVRERGVVPRDVTGKDENHNFVPDDLSNYKVVRVGQFAMNKMKAWQGSYGVSRHEGVVSPAYFVFDLAGIHGDFFHNAIRSRPYVHFFAQASDGVRIGQWDLSQSRMKEIPFAVPSDQEQAAIVRFLDYATVRIGKAIRAKQKLVKLVEEQKQAIIHLSVTRGLDPNVRVKPSGIEWLGDVPERWEVLRVKHCAKVISKGTTPSTEGLEILDAGPVRFLKAENISAGRITENPKCFIDENTHSALKRSQLAGGDVLFVIAGATLGKIATVDAEVLPANTNQAVAFVRPNDRVEANYLALWLQSARIKELTWLNAVQSAQPNLSMADLGAFVIPLPCIEEQRAILTVLETQVSIFDGAIIKIVREISFLREYRTRLIADVVTGKLDIREASARLPEEPSDLEAAGEPEAWTDEEPTESDGADEAAVEEAEA